MHCLCLIRNYHNSISNLIIHLQIFLSNWLTVVHNQLRLFPRVTCTVHRDCANGKYICVNRASGFSFVVTALRSVPLLSVSSAQQNLHTCKMSTASKSSFLPVWLRSTRGTKQGVLFPRTSTTSRIVAGTGPYVSSITLSHSYLPLTQWGFFCNSHPRAYTDDVEKLQIPIIHARSHICLSSETGDLWIIINIQDELKLKGN